MSELGVQLQSSLGHKKVLIIDDAYNAAPALQDIGDDALRNCREALEDDKVHAVFEQLAKRKVEVERLDEVLADEEALGDLWAARNTDTLAKKALDLLFQAAGKALTDKRKPIIPLEELITHSLKLELVTLGTRDLEPDGKLSEHAGGARLFFVDYYLDPESKGQESVDECVRKVATIYGKYHAGDKPIVVLMSSEVLTKEQQQGFRRNLSALGSHFTFIHKPELSDAVGVQIKLDGLRQTYKQACAIDKALYTWEQAAQKSVQECVQDLRALDISDYAFLDKFRLDNERVHLGHYVLSLYGEYLNSVIEKHPAINTTADELDAISMDTLFPPALMPNEELVKIYSGAVFTDFRPKPPRKRATDDADLYRIMLGDIYRIRYAGDLMKIDEAYAVITPACNLARAVSETRVTMLRGVLRPKASVLDWDMVPEFLNIANQTYAATWDLDGPLVKTAREIKEACDSGAWERVTRLRPLYALSLQRSHAADLLRVGMPIATQWYYPISAEVVGRGAGNVATQLMACEDTDGLVWQITGGEQPGIVLLERFVTRLHAVLAASDKPKEKELVGKLDDLVALRAPFHAKKGKEVKVGAFAITFLQKYEQVEKNTSSSPVWIRVFPGALAPTAKEAPELAASSEPSFDATAMPAADASGPLGNAG